MLHILALFLENPQVSNQFLVICVLNPQVNNQFLVCVVLPLFWFLGCELLCQSRGLWNISGLSLHFVAVKRTLFPYCFFFVVILFPCISLNTDTNNVKRWQNLGSSASDFFLLFWEEVLRRGKQSKLLYLSFPFLPSGTCRWALLT